jgi:hypothetical protein
MYGIVLGVTPPGAIRKMNQDNDCLFNANLMNELMYVHACYEYDCDYSRMLSCRIMFMNKSMRCYKTSTSHGIEQVKNVTPMKILGFPNRPV